MAVNGKQIGTWALVTLAVILSSLNVQSAITRSRALTPPDALVAQWREYAAVGQWIGPPAAPVTIVAFSDYECPACKQFDHVLEQLRARFRDSLAVVVRHLPLPKHVQAVPAARSAICAGVQARFAELNTLLFHVQDSLGRIPLVVLASRAGVPDTSAFRRCLEDPATDAILRRDFAAAERLGTLSTPTLLVGDRLYRGLPSDLDRIIAHVMAEVRTGGNSAATLSTESR